jgi:hypothetical protein
MKKEEFKLITTPSLMEPNIITFKNNGESTPIIELKAKCSWRHLCQGQSD